MMDLPWVTGLVSGIARIQTQAVGLRARPTNNAAMIPLPDTRMMNLRLQETG